MSETFRYPKLAAIVGRQPYPDPLPEVRGTAADIDSNIQHFTVGHANQLALGIFQLIVQPTKYAFLRLGVVVLDKGCAYTGFFFERFGVETLVEETAVITEYFRFEDQYTRQISSNYVH
ncbi:hypothetical protein D9M71_509180 [compost metagenome]